ncbi:MAG: glutathione S-transferase N-terminal domain-containing protein [Myxococcota bacterium]
MTEIVLHHLERSRSTRVLWLLEELGLEYTMVTHQRDPKTIRAPKELEAIHPLGKAPTVVVDGEALAETGAILETLVDELGEGRLRPSDPALLRRYRYFMHYAEGSLMPPLLVKLIFEKVKTAPLPFFVKPIAKGIVGKVQATFYGPELAKHSAFLEAEVAKGEFLAGEFSAADIQMSYPLEALASRGGTETPNIAAYLARLHARPAYAKALEKGGPVML